VAEDSPDDLFLLTRAFHKAGLDHLLLTAGDGEAAIHYLQSHPAPDLVVLDLKLPRLNGFEVLQQIRRTPKLKSLPVVMLSSSPVPEDKQRAKDLGASDYFVKSANLDSFVRQVDARFMA